MMNYKFSLIRIIDIFLSIFIILFSLPILLLIYFLLFFKNGSPLFFQERVGKNLRKFTLIKFRTMIIGTKDCPTHLVDRKNITPLGDFIRKTKIDEIPQFFNVLKGEMSIVGPRPCLFNQKELINERKKLNIHKVTPGITGLAQIKGIDMSNPKLLAEVELSMIKNFTIKKYFYYFFKTLIGKGFGDNVKKIEIDLYKFYFSLMLLISSLLKESNTKY